MVDKRFKSQAAAGLLSKETNVHFINPFTNKIDLKMFTEHLFEKDEHANLELDPSMFDDVSFSDNQFVSIGTLSCGWAKLPSPRISCSAKPIRVLLLNK